MILKRLASPRIYPIPRKRNKFVVFPRGGYRLEESLPLATIIRDILKLADNLKECKKICKKVLLNGRKVSYNQGIGFLDVISIPEINKYYRVCLNSNGFVVKPIERKEADKKVARIDNIRYTNGGKIQLSLYGGYSVISKHKYEVGDSLLIKLPELEIIKPIKFEKGKIALALKGSNMGRIGRIESTDGEGITLSTGQDKFIVPKNYVYVIGDKEMEVTV